MYSHTDYEKKNERTKFNNHSSYMITGCFNDQVSVVNTCIIVSFIFLKFYTFKKNLNTQHEQLAMQNEGCEHSDI